MPFTQISLKTPISINLVNELATARTYLKFEKDKIINPTHPMRPIVLCFQGMTNEGYTIVSSQYSPSELTDIFSTAPQHIIQSLKDALKGTVLELVSPILSPPALSLESSSSSTTTTSNSNLPTKKVDYIGSPEFITELKALLMEQNKKTNSSKNSKISDDINAAAKKLEEYAGLLSKSKTLTRSMGSDPKRQTTQSMNSVINSALKSVISAGAISFSLAALEMAVARKISPYEGMPTFLFNTTPKSPIPLKVVASIKKEIQKENRPLIITPEQLKKMDPRVRKLMLSKNGVTALNERVISADDAIRITTPRNTQIGLPSPFHTELEYASRSILIQKLQLSLSNNGLYALRKRLLNIGHVEELSYYKLNWLLSNDGINALETGKINPSLAISMSNQEFDEIILQHTNTSSSSSTHVRLG